MFSRIFLDHPKTVGESYWEHFGVATSFGRTMIMGGIRAVLHGFFPNIFKTSGSDTVRSLHAVLVEKRAATAQMHTVEWMI